MEESHLKAVVEVLRAVLYTPNHNREEFSSDNKANALYLLNKIEKRFGSDITGDDYFDLMNRSHERQLYLDVKRRIGNHKIDNSLLDTNEYLEYYGIHTHDLNSSQREKVRN